MKYNIEQIYQLYLQASGISTDTRKIKEKSIFFALKGENFDGNKFAKDALNEGAKYAVIDDISVANDDNRFILVENVLQTLQDLAAYHRQKLHIPIIGITGTNGKTTTKELVNAVLSTQYRVVATQGNLNNHIGVPLTLLEIDHKHTQIAIVEMGANHIGEIAFLCQIAQPTHGLITNIGTAHLEGFGSQNGIIETKKALYEAVKHVDGTLFVNADDDLLLQLAGNAKQLTYGKQGVVKGICNEKKMYMTFRLPEFNKTISTQLTGAYNFPNAMAAVAVGLHFGIDIEDIVYALISYKPTNSRSQVEEIHGHTIIVDAYNANPSSMKEAILNMSKLKSEHKILILGSMKELGTESRKEHEKIIKLIEQQDFEQVYLLGKEYGQTTNPKILSSDSFEEMVTAIQKNIPSNSTILLKGSRSMKMERFLEIL